MEHESPVERKQYDLHRRWSRASTGINTDHRSSNEGEMRHIAQSSASAATTGMLRTWLQPTIEKVQKTVINCDKALPEQPQ